MNELVTTTGELLRSILGERIEIEALLADDLWNAEVDQLQAQAALINLCINARDAMPDGGTLRFETRNVSLNEQYVAHNPEASAGDYVLLAVTHGGAGESDEQPDFDFEGLAQFMKQRGGFARIYNVQGHGTTVRLYFRRAEQARVMPRSAASIAGGTERILVVDDDAEFRESVVQQLEKLGYRVSAAADASEGLAILRREPAFDLLLSDVVMPWPMNGKELAEAVRKRWGDLPILFMSGYAESTIHGHGLLEANMHFLGKPFRNADLARAIRRVLDA